MDLFSMDPAKRALA